MYRLREIQVGEVNRVMPLLAAAARTQKQSSMFLRSSTYPNTRFLPRVLLTAEPKEVQNSSRCLMTKQPPGLNVGCWKDSYRCDSHHYSGLNQKLRSQMPSKLEIKSLVKYCDVRSPAVICSPSLWWLAEQLKEPCKILHQNSFLFFLLLAAGQNALVLLVDVAGKISFSIFSPF